MMVRECQVRNRLTSSKPAVWTMSPAKPCRPFLDELFDEIVLVATRSVIA
jgi:hypothetical protein